MDPSPPPPPASGQADPARPPVRLDRPAPGWFAAPPLVALGWVAFAATPDLRGHEDLLGEGLVGSTVRVHADAWLAQGAGALAIGILLVGALLRLLPASARGRPGGLVATALAVAVPLLPLVVLGAARLQQSLAATAAMRSRPHVVIVSIDTLRADHLGCYGYERDTSPHLDDLARRGVRFDRAWAQSTATLSSHLSMFSSLYPPQIGIVRDDGSNFVQNVTRLRLADRAVTVAEAFGAAGYRTAAFTGGGLMAPTYGHDQGYEHFWHAGQPAESTLEVSLPRLLDWVDATRAGAEDGDELRLFLFLHTYDVHDPYRAPAPFKKAFSSRRAEQFVRQEGYAPTILDLKANLPDPSPEELAEIVDFYDNGVRYADDRLAALEDALRERGLWEDTLLVVLSDHGEEFQDHGDWGHGPSVHRELAQVPLVLRFPGDEHAGTVVEAPVELVDLGPTLADRAGLPRPPDWRGRSWMPLIEAAARPDADGPRGAEGAAHGADVAGRGANVRPPLDDRPVYTDIANARLGIHGLRRDGRLLVHDRAEDTVALYDTIADPLEHRDLAGEHPGEAAALREELTRWIAELVRGSAHLQAEPMDDDQLSLVELEQVMLQQLGYVK